MNPRGAFLVVLVLSFLSLACWSFADPLVAAPDEQAHVIRAVALDHGQLGHRATPTSKVQVTVSVPASINESKFWMICWRFHAKVSALCSPAWTNSSTMVSTTTHVGHYPPFYYALVGTGSYVSEQRGGIYWMRLVSDAMSAVMLALCAYVAVRWSRRRSLIVGLFVSLTPVTLFLSSSVNPSGFEITTAICLWTAAAVYALDYPTTPPRGLVVVIGATASILTLVRGLSPLWVALVAAVLAMFVGPSQLIRLVRARRDVQFALAAVCLCGLFAVWWIFSQGTLNVLASHVRVPRGASEFQTMRLVADHLFSRIRESIGVLGWLDTPMPTALYLVWYALPLILLGVALARSTWRQRIALVTLVVLVLVVPVIVISRRAHEIGIVWQWRDALPLAVGAVIFSAGLFEGPSGTGMLRRRVAVAIVATVSLLQVVAFYVNLRRYAVGVNGPHLFFLRNQGWSPPTGQLLTLATYGLVTASLGALAMLWLITSSGPLDPVARGARPTWRERPSL
jgi:hypothetical protein